MATRARSPFAALRWLREAVRTLWRAPGTLFVAACVILLLSWLPAFVVVPIATSVPGYAWAVVLALVGSGLAPLVGGLLRVVASVEQGAHANVRDLFVPYRDGTWLGMVSFAFLVWGIAALGAMAVAGPSGTDILLGAIWLVLILSIWGLGICQLVLARRTVLASLADGVVGTLKNLPGVIVMAIAAYIPWLFVFALDRQGGFYVVAAAAGALQFALAYCLAYAFWRDVCGDPTSIAFTEA